jgi:hypothetical protein
MWECIITKLPLGRAIEKLKSFALMDIIQVKSTDIIIHRSHPHTNFIHINHPQKSSIHTHPSSNELGRKLLSKTQTKFQERWSGPSVVVWRVVGCEQPSPIGGVAKFLNSTTPPISRQVPVRPWFPDHKIAKLVTYYDP